MAGADTFPGDRGRSLRWIDVLTAASSIGVVYLHCNLLFWTRPAGASGWLSNAIECIFYCCVPVFFMISGYTLLDFRKRYGTREFLVRRFQRAGVPFLFWSVVFWFVMDGQGGVKDLVLSVLNTTAMPIYWFFPPLFGCYVAILVLSQVGDRLKLFSFLAGLLLLTNSLLPFCEKVFHLGVSAAWKWPMGPEFVMFVLLGYLLGHARLERKGRWLVYGLGILGFGAHFFGTWTLSPVGGPVSMVFKNYTNWPSVLYSSAVFVAFANADWEWLFAWRPVAWLVDRVKAASLSIYLLHGFFVYYLIPRHLPRIAGPDYGSSAVYRLLMPVALVGACVVLHCAIRRVPVVRRVLG